MKGFILAAGLGTRLLPYSARIAKPAFPVLGMPLVEWVVAGLRNAGVTELVVNLHHIPESVVGVLGDGSRLGVGITYSHEERVLGTGGALVRALDLIGDSDGVLVHNGDIFSDWDIGRLVGASARTVLGVLDGSRLDPSERRVELAPDGSVSALRGLPAPGGGRKVVYGGVSVVGPQILDILRDTVARRGDDSFSPCLVGDGLIPALRLGIRPASVEFDDTWYCDIGTIGSYLDLCSRAIPAAPMLLSRRGFPVPPEIGPSVFVSGRARIDSDVVFHGPAFVSDGAWVGTGATIGPNVTCSGRIMPGSDVGNAVVMAGAVVSGKFSGIALPDGPVKNNG